MPRTAPLTESKIARRTIDLAAAMKRFGSRDFAESLRNVTLTPGGAAATKAKEELVSILAQYEVEKLVEQQETAAAKTAALRRPMCEWPELLLKELDIAWIADGQRGAQQFFPRHATAVRPGRKISVARLNLVRRLAEWIERWTCAKLTKRKLGTFIGTIADEAGITLVGAEENASKLNKLLPGYKPHKRAGRPRKKI